MIEVIKLHCSLGGIEVLKGVSFRIEKGEVLALIGRSGVGKSVLLKHVVGLLRAEKGEVIIEGEEIGRCRGRALERVRSKFGFLFQGGALFDSLTVFDNVAFPLREKTKMNGGEIRERVLYELEQVGLEGMGHKYPAELSGGMKKRAALARSLVTDPKILLFDEPTTGLDPVTTNAINALIKETHDRLKFTGIIVSHEIPEIFSLVHKVAMLYKGAIIAMGTPEEILASDNPIVKEFITGGSQK